MVSRYTVTKELRVLQNCIHHSAVQWVTLAFFKVTEGNKILKGPIKVPFDVKADLCARGRISVFIFL